MKAPAEAGRPPVDAAPPTRAERDSRRARRAIAARATSFLPFLLLALFGLQLVLALRGDASVADEHPHILSGFLYWKGGRFSGGLDNPPLGQLLVASPLVVLRQPYAFPSDAALWLCRLPVVLAALGLAVLLWRWGIAWGGPALGLCVLAVLDLEPNLLAHGHLATLDLPVTLAWWAALWFWRRTLLLERAVPTAAIAPRARAAGFFALFFAAAILTKFTGLLLAPAAALTALVTARSGRSLARAGLALAAAALGFVLLSHLVYRFEATALGLPQHLVHALQGKAGHREEGHFAYLAGRRSTQGFLEYYLVALLLKTPLPLLGLAAYGTVRLARRGPRLDLWLLLLPAALLVIAFSLVRVDIGVRHVLPVYPALVLCGAYGVFELARRGRASRALAAALMFVWGIGVAGVAPRYLAYFNVLAGGARGGDRWLLDSNLDWGQDDARLENFLRQAAARGETWEVDPPGTRARAGRFAVNADALHNLMRSSEAPYAWLRPLVPSGFAGSAWRLYRLETGDFVRRASARPDDVAAQVAAAEAIEAAGDTLGADRRYEDAARRFASDVLVPRSAAQGALLRGDWRRARQWVERGLDVHPEDAALQQLRERVQREARLSTAVGRDSLAAARARLELGLWRAEHGEVAAAVPLLRRAAAALPEDLEAQGAYAVALARRGDFEMAMALFEREHLERRMPEEYAACRRLRAAQHDVDRGALTDAAAGYDLARAHFDDERYDAAAAALVATLRVEPDDAAVLALLCEVQVRCKLRVVRQSLAPRRIEVSR